MLHEQYLNSAATEGRGRLLEEAANFVVELPVAFHVSVQSFSWDWIDIQCAGGDTDRRFYKTLLRNRGTTRGSSSAPVSVGPMSTRTTPQFSTRRTIWAEERPIR